MAEKSAPDYVGSPPAAAEDDGGVWAARDLHITTDSPPQVRIDGRMVPLEAAPLDAVPDPRLCYSVMTDQQKHRLEEDLEVDFSFGLQGHGPLPRQRLQPAGRHRRRASAPSRRRSESFEQLGLPPVGPDPVRQAPRPGAGDRRDRLRQVHHPGRHDRQDQRPSARAHPHHRGPDRVRAQAQALPGEPAGDPRRHPQLQEGPARRPCARTPTWCWSARCATWRPSSRP